VKKVLITGASGQDAHYVSEICCRRGDRVVGVSQRIREDARYKFFNHIVEWKDLVTTMHEEQPDEVYHLAARHRSSEQSEDDERGVFRDNLDLLENTLAATAATVPAARVLLAGSCRAFGNRAEAGTSLREDSEMFPIDGYGFVKYMALQLGQAYRRTGVLQVCTAILFNHESPLRSADFVTQKIAQAAARKEKVVVRDLQARVDWGHAADYARAMVMMLGAPHLDDYVVASGGRYSVLDFVMTAYEHVGLDWREYVTESGEVGGRTYVGDNARITRELGWRPEISFDAMVREMVDAAAKGYPH
jgi:GDPmannose 4,6-dehydratase